MSLVEGYLMVEIWLPYGSSEIPARIPEERLVQILKPQKMENIADPVSELKGQIESDQPFLEGIKTAGRICVILGPSSNPQITSNLAKTLIESILSHGSAPSSVTLLRTPNAPTSELELPVDVKSIVHDPSSSPTLVAQDTKCDFPVALDSVFSEADFRIVLGELKPHHLMGFSGLSDAVFPGLASRDSAQGQLTSRKDVGIGNLYGERTEIAGSLKNSYALGFVLDADLNPARISFWKFQVCLKELEETVQLVCTSKIERPADVVVLGAGGKPVDESLLMAVETFPAALPALKKDGVVIFAAECPLGHGDTEFYRWSAEHKEPRYLEARLRHSFNFQGYKAALLSRLLETHRIYLISTIPDYYVENIFAMHAAPTVNTALHTVQRTLGSDSTISVIPDASKIITNQAQSTKPAVVGWVLCPKLLLHPRCR
jgi:nickel-dependent lactate racemase